MSGFVRLEKDSKHPVWEVACMTYSLDGNILNACDTNNLWKMTRVKEAHFMSIHVRTLYLKNGKFDARHLFRKGI
jgi:hypothetical protein